jgi:hypothetical protein
MFLVGTQVPTQRLVVRLVLTSRGTLNPWFRLVTQVARKACEGYLKSSSQDQLEARPPEFVFATVRSPASVLDGTCQMQTLVFVTMTEGTYCLLFTTTKNPEF